MKKFAIQITILLLAIGGSLFFLSPFKRSGNIDLPFLPQTVSTSDVQVGNTVIKVEIADTSSKRNKGLSERDSLELNSGMLFVFEKPDRHNFWMKGMKIPLDFLWILDDKIVDITENVPTQVGVADKDLTIYSSKTETNKVLEVNAGYAAANNIKIGDTIIIK